jgi:hypothetical protein
MKTPSTVTPALTRAQIDAIVSASVIRPDSPQATFSESQSLAQWPRNLGGPQGGVSESAQTSIRTAAATAADYGCVDWYIYPDSHRESDSASEAA